VQQDAKCLRNTITLLYGERVCVDGTMVRKSDSTILVRNLLRVSQGLLLTIVGRRGEQGVLQTIQFNLVATGEDRMSKSEVDIVQEIVGVCGPCPLSCLEFFGK